METSNYSFDAGLETGLLSTLTGGESDAVEQAIAGIVPRLGMMGEQLRQTSVQIEEAVVGVCNSFQDIATRASLGVTRTATFLRSSEGETANGSSFEHLVSTCDATLMRMMETSTESGRLAQQALERIQCVDGKAREISGSLARMEDISRGNKILALNAQIEAARCGEYGGGFKAVAIELSSQTDLSRQVTGLVEELVDSLRAMANSTMKDLQTMHDQTVERTNRCRQEVESTLLALRETHRTMQTMFHEANEQGALLADDIGLAIRGMQFQDRVSQRIGHVVHDLEVMQQKLPGLASGQACNDNDFSSFVMQEERAICGIGGDEAAGGDIELF